MERVFITDDFLKELIMARGIDLKVSMFLIRKTGVDTGFTAICNAGLGRWFGRWYGMRPPYPHIFNMTVEGRSLVKAIIGYEEAEPRDSTEERLSSVLHGDTLYSWSRSAAVREIENLRVMRQRKEERASKRKGERGCHETRCIAQPRPSVAICVDDCRDEPVLRGRRVSNKGNRRASPSGSYHPA